MPSGALLLLSEPQVQICFCLTSCPQPKISCTRILWLKTNQPTNQHQRKHPQSSYDIIIQWLHGFTWFGASIDGWHPESTISLSQLAISFIEASHAMSPNCFLHLSGPFPREDDRGLVGLRTIDINTPCYAPLFILEKWNKVWDISWSDSVVLWLWANLLHSSNLSFPVCKLDWMVLSVTWSFGWGLHQIIHLLDLVNGLASDYPSVLVGCFIVP